MPHLQNQPNASHITSPNSPPSNRWMTNVVGNNGKFEVSIVVVVKDGNITNFITTLVHWEHFYFYILTARLHFYPPEFRFFQSQHNPPNHLSQATGSPSTLSLYSNERRSGNMDEYGDSQLSHQHQEISNPFPIHHSLQQANKLQKPDEMLRADPLTTLMNGKL